MMKLHLRSLNKNERYACTQTDIRTTLCDVGIRIWFGLERRFTFDRTHKHHPQINGTVIASIMLNTRTSIPPDTPILCFYPIADKGYDEQCRRAFVEQCIPQLSDWCQNNQNVPNRMPGIEGMLIIWDQGRFETVSYHHP